LSFDEFLEGSFSLQLLGIALCSVHLAFGLVGEVMLVVIGVEGLQLLLGLLYDFLFLSGVCF
jgi:hypothetical protein